MRDAALEEMEKFTTWGESNEDGLIDDFIKDCLAFLLTARIGTWGQLYQETKGEICSSTRTCFLFGYYTAMKDRFNKSIKCKRRGNDL